MSSLSEDSGLIVVWRSWRTLWLSKFGELCQLVWTVCSSQVAKQNSAGSLCGSMTRLSDWEVKSYCHGQRQRITCPPLWRKKQRAWRMLPPVIIVVCRDGGDSLVKWLAVLLSSMYKVAPAAAKKLWNTKKVWHLRDCKMGAFYT